MANVKIKATGVNMRPTTPRKMKIGKNDTTMMSSAETIGCASSSDVSRTIRCSSLREVA